MQIPISCFQIGPVLPNESGIHKSTTTASLPNSSVINGTLAHAMNATYNQTVHEQKAKRNETESNFKLFQSVKTPSTGGIIPPPSNNNNKDGGASQQLPGNGDNEEDLGDGGDDQNMNPGDEAGEEIGEEDGGDNGENGENSSSEGLSRVLELLRSNKLSDAQRRELVQRLLKAQGPDSGGD